jgi:hypothetical protein
MRQWIWLLIVGFWLGASAAGAAGQGERYVFYEDFEGGGLPPGWTVLNDNGDSSTWEARDVGGARNSPAPRYLANPSRVADDWLFSSAIALAPATTHTLHFHYRVTSPAAAHRLAVSLGSGASPASMTLPLVSLPSITNDAIRETSATFRPPAGPSNWYLGFHCTSDPNRLALYVDDVIVGRPETDLAIGFQLDKIFYDHTNVYTSTETMRSLTYVENRSSGPLTVNGFLSVGHESNPQVILSFHVVGPGGLPVPFKMRYKLPIPGTGDFQTLAPGGAVRKYYNLNNGALDFTSTGTYTIQAIYRNIHPIPGGGDPWRGQLVSDPVALRIGGGQ